MYGKLITILFVGASIGILCLVISRMDNGSHNMIHVLSEPEIREMFPCKYYPGHASSPGRIEILSKYSDSIALARLVEFEFNGFESAEIEWNAVFTLSKYLKGQGGTICSLPIRSPERNFGPGAEGRLFILFMKNMGGESLWILEPWLPESEDMASSW